MIGTNASQMTRYCADTTSNLFQNVPLTHYFVNSQFSSSLETDLNENDEYLTPALLLEFSAECGSEEISSVLPSNYNAKAARKDANLAALSALPVIFSLDAVKGWHLSNSKKSIIGDQKSIISARLL